MLCLKSMANRLLFETESTFFCFEANVAHMSILGVPLGLCKLEMEKCFAYRDTFEGMYREYSVFENNEMTLYIIVYIVCSVQRG